MRHPDEFQLALFAGGDLGLWDRWQVGRHVSRCSTCESEVAALRASSEKVREALPDLPKDLNWNRLAEEMTGNIRSDRAL
jgi:anti-sigma factor ChrR (cupin superfamily)